MAQTIKATPFKSRQSLGSQLLVTVEVELGTEYKNTGVEITAAELKAAGLPEGVVYAGWVNPIGTTELTALYSLVVSGADTPTQKVLIVGYVLGEAVAAKPFKEQADKAALVKEQKLLVTLIGH